MVATAPARARRETPRTARRAQRATWRALGACRTAWAHYLAAKLGQMTTPAGRAELARGVSPETAARLAPFDPFLRALLIDRADVERIGAYLPGIARALRVEGDLSDAQILDAARLYADELHREIRTAALVACEA